MKILTDDNLTVTIVTSDNGLEMTYNDVTSFNVKTLEQCILDGDELDPSEVEFYDSKDKFFVFSSKGYKGVFAVCTASCIIY